MAISKKTREIVYQKYNCKCAYCGTELKEIKSKYNAKTSIEALDEDEKHIL